MQWVAADMQGWRQVGKSSTTQSAGNGRGYGLVPMRVVIKILLQLQGGPPTSYKYGYKSTYRGYNPSYPIIRPFIGVITPFITSRGPPCSLEEGFYTAQLFI